MTRLIHDQFAKDYLESLLEEFGIVRTPRRVASEQLQIDVWFEPAREQIPDLEALGSLGKMAAIPSLFEPFRNAATVDEICDCVQKRWSIKKEFQRKARNNNQQLDPETIPKLWVLTPTASERVLGEFPAIGDRNNLPGFYLLGSAWQTTIIAIHQLPPIPETLWLRVLGRDKVQEQAIDELETLPPDHPFRQRALNLLYNLQQHLRSQQRLETGDRELIMRLAPLWQQERDRIQQEAERRIQQEADRRIQQERDRIQQERDRIQQEADRLQQERDRIQQEADRRIQQEADRLQQERDRIQQEAERRIQQERDRNQQQIARNLFRMGMGIEQVSEVTGLSLEQLAQLRDVSSDVE